MIKTFREFMFDKTHTHVYELHGDADEIWLECGCKHQKDVPEERLQEAYQKLGNRDFSWKD